MKEDKSNLRKAIFALLKDKYDTPDLELNSSEDYYIDIIIDALIEENEKTCPFKNYGCIDSCKYCNEKCEDGLNVDCERELQEVWREFAEID